MRHIDPTIDYIATHLANTSEGTVLSDRTAGQLWGLWIPQFDGVEITTPATERGSRYTTSVQNKLVTAHRRALAPEDITEHNGLPITTIERTWIDLAGHLDIYDLIAAGDSALRSGASQPELAARVAALQRSRGAVRARAAVGLLDPRSRSRPESRIRGAIILGGLPEPSVNEPIYDRFGGWLAEPDLHYKEARVAIEYNGEDHAKVTRMRKDSVRTLDMQREDWEIRIYTAPHAYVRLDEVVSDVYELLRKRAPQLLVATRLSRRVTHLEDGRRRKRRL